jgi:hypothetical protein
VPSHRKSLFTSSRALRLERSVLFLCLDGRKDVFLVGVVGNEWRDRGLDVPGKADSESELATAQLTQQRSLRVLLCAAQYVGNIPDAVMKDVNRCVSSAGGRVCSCIAFGTMKIGTSGVLDYVSCEGE